MFCRKRHLDQPGLQSHTKVTTLTCWLEPGRLIGSSISRVYTLRAGVAGSGSSWDLIDLLFRWLARLADSS